MHCKPAVNLISRHVATRPEAGFVAYAPHPISIRQKDGNRERLAWLIAGGRTAFARCPPAHDGRAEAPLDHRAHRRRAASLAPRTRPPDEPAFARLARPSPTLAAHPPTPDPFGPRGQRAQLTRSTDVARRSRSGGDRFADLVTIKLNAGRRPNIQQARIATTARAQRLAAYTPASHLEELPIHAPKGPRCRGAPGHRTRATRRPRSPPPTSG